MTTTRAIIFDCYGVLTSDGWIPFKKKYFGADGADPALEAQATDLSKSLNAGYTSLDEFTHEVASLAGVSKSEAYSAIQENAANEELFTYIQTALKPHYRIGMLSNAGSDMLAELFTAEQVALFDMTALSYATGLLKPQAEAYLDAAERLGVSPADCVFIDDQQRYCTAAEDAGMRAVWYQNFDQMQRQLEAVL
jgi:HAD superfamily hydrolase (TIGR01509 family)